LNTASGDSESSSEFDRRAGVTQQFAVIGAGVIGSGVAQTAAQSGFETIVLDISREALHRTRSAMKSFSRMQQLMGKRRGRGPSAALDAIRFTTDYADLAQADFVVENVTENWETKREVYLQLDRICRRDTIFAVNSSVIPITRLASLVTEPSRVLGIHFMNPVPLIDTVEMIRGALTSEETLEKTRTLLAHLGKRWVEVNDSPGFISNRVLMLAVNEAVFALHEQVATAEDIDRVFTACFGHKMGLLATADLIGLDTVLLSIEELYSAFNDPKFRPCPLLRQMVWSGRCGRKSGRGFFEYDITA
jgi:3-hydroxybutyryl-CoA dehydrogenase